MITYDEHEVYRLNKPATPYSFICDALVRVRKGVYRQCRAMPTWKRVNYNVCAPHAHAPELVVPHAYKVTE